MSSEQYQGTFDSIIKSHVSGEKNYIGKAIVANEDVILEGNIDEDNRNDTSKSYNNDRSEASPLVTVHINNLQGNTVQFEEEKNDDDIINMYTIAARQTLDDKQMAAYSIICCSFMMRYLINTSSQSHEKRACRAILKMIANKISYTATKDDIKEMLKERGAQEQLVMFLSGPAGSGKSHVISSCQQCCKMFCDHAELPFDSDIFRITACTGSAAASLESGTTIHSAAEINKNEKNITYNSEEWEYTNILLIDEISFFGYNSLVKLDKNLRLLTGDRGQIYGGRNLFFVGDFKQLRTF